MGRRIITKSLQSFQVTGGQTQTVDTYFDKILKNIPADIVGAWVVVTGFISAATDVPTATLLWIAFVFGLVITFFWTLRQTTEPNKPPALTQCAIATGSFFVWVFALGGPFATLAVYRPVYGSLLLVAYTLVTAIVNPPEK